MKHKNWKYEAPEVLQNHDYNTHSDKWGFG